MRLTPTTRLIAVSVLLAAATGLVWWLVGFPLGKLLLDDAPAWSRAFAYGNRDLMRLLALAITVPLTAAVAGAATPQIRWLAIAAVALGAVLLYDPGRGDAVALLLFVLAAAAVSESSGKQQAIVAVVIAIVVAFAALTDLTLGTSQKVFAVLLRAIFFYAPLLLGPTYLERFALKRVSR